MSTFSTKSMNNVFSITLANIDSYQAPPISELDVTFSEFRGSEVKKVPVIRIFGSTATGKKTCLHVHGAFPYMYVPCTDQENLDSLAYQLASSIDSALNTSFGSTLSTNQHVYKIQKVSGIPFYGYHSKEHLFFKIYFYNPAIIRRTSELMQNGAILGQQLQPYESHIPYILQFMIDYNLYGMNLINLNNVRYRQGHTTADSQNKTITDPLNSEIYLPTSVTRQSTCELEVDGQAFDILNKQNVTEKMELNPGLAVIWKEEKARRAVVGLENAKSQLLYSRDTSRIALPPTSNDIFQEAQLLKRLNAISQSDESVVSNTSVSTYPIEVEDDEDVLNASHVLNHSLYLASTSVIDRRTLDDRLSRSISFAETNQSQNRTADNFLDADDIQLVEMLADLAEENKVPSNVDDDSVLGSQYSMFSEPARNDPEEEEEMEDLNITSLDLNSLSSWESTLTGSNQHDDAVKVVRDENNHESSNNSHDIDEKSCEDITLVNLPQLDGAIVTDSSDSEQEVDVTIDKHEKRICVYKNRKKNVSQSVATTPKKRPLEHDDGESLAKRRNTGAGTLKRKTYGSPSKVSRSPSKNYTPLDIIITSPKISRSPSQQRGESPRRKQHVQMSDQIPSTSASTTPKRTRHPLCMRLLREKHAANLLSSDLENNTNNVREKLMADKTNTESVQVTNDITTVDVIEATIDHKSVQKRKTKNSEDLLVKINAKEVCKKLHFSIDHDEMENTLVGSDRRSMESENLIASEQPADRTNEDAIVSLSGNENEDILLNSQPSGKSSDASPERDYASGIRNLADKFMKSCDDDDDVIPETDLDEDEEDACNTTFTQHVSQRMESDSLNFPSQRSARSSTNALITITTKYKPPTAERISESITMYGIPSCRMTKPFFSNKHDLAKHMESAGVNALRFDVPAFKSSLEEVTSIKLWRRMKVNEFYPSGSSIKTRHLKRTLAGYNLLTIRPLAAPPLSRDVQNWIRAKKYLSDKDRDVKSFKKEEEKLSDAHNPSLINIANGEQRSEAIDRSTNDISNTEKSVSSTQNMPSDTTAENKARLDTQNSSDSQHSSRDVLNPSLRKALENPLLYKQNETLQSRYSFGQIEYSSKGSSGNVSNENLQKVRAISTHQHLTLLSLEVHVVTRDDLLPDPQYDPIAALFYAIYCDVSTDTSEQIEYGAIIVNSSSVNSRLNQIHSASAMCPISYVAMEQDVLNGLIELIEQHNPDILVGWEVEALSWGYVFQRASHLALTGFPLKISRVPYVPISSKYEAHTDDASDIKVIGRNILDVWRIMRHEAALLTYTFENVVHHVLHERIPYFSFKTLTSWWKHESMITRCRVIQHYVIRVRGTLKILNHLDIIGRTCELARLFGIQFYEVFSRGSQFRVESMMLRLAKPMNYIAISPSVHQKAKMRAPECIPLIMEPESEFYTDPLVVLDFQSLYPSMIIAYNYCFSTCLGRIEHIGQCWPFPFGAATLRVKKSTALRLRDKMNFSPCGVAFVKKEVREGILPRMLSEILNTRLMVKESMKLHPADNRTLQRVLHSQQLGLKLIANVTYGYTSANFSGRMPCIEIGDSVVSKGRETLERAIKLVEDTPKWNARVVYGDTDSLFVLLPGRSRKEAFVIGEEIANAVTATNPPPVKLKFEKVLQPAILQTKKRYCGYMYETRDQEKPEFLAKGIETIRRDGCPAVAKILEKSLKILFDTKDVSQIKSYITRQFDKIFRRRVSVQDLTFAKEFRGMRGYKANACVPALELTRRLIKKDPRAVPRTSERVRYIIIAGAPNQALIHCVRTPMEVILDPALIPNTVYYITKVIIPPLNRCFNLLGIDVNTWYKEMSRRQSFNNVARLNGNNAKVTIHQFFSSTTCLVCGQQTNREICGECQSQSSRTVLVLLEKICQLERTHQQIAAICHSCVGRSCDIECVSLDCPILYRLVEARKELAQVPFINNIIYGNNSNGIKAVSAVAEWY